MEYVTSNLYVAQFIHILIFCVIQFCICPESIYYPESNYYPNIIIVRNPIIVWNPIIISVIQLLCLANIRVLLYIINMHFNNLKRLSTKLGRICWSIRIIGKNSRSRDSRQRTEMMRDQDERCISQSRQQGGTIMKKKIIAAVLCAAMVMTTAGCGHTASGSDAKASSAASTQASWTPRKALALARKPLL